MGGEDIPEEGVGCRAVKVETPGILGTRQSRQRSRKAGRGWKMTAPPARQVPTRGHQPDDLLPGLQKGEDR